MRRLLVTGLTLALAACAHGRADIASLGSNSDQIVWEAAEKAASKREWESARQHYRRIIDGFPQSQYGPAARIALGDSYFTEGGNANYILAASAYRDFLTLYPSHPRSDYAQFRVAESYFRQKNGPDRDQTNTQHALEEYQRLVELYPASSQMETTRQRIAECRRSLATAEFNIGYFYQRTRKAYRAAIQRYELLLKGYPDYAGIDAALYRLSECLLASGRTAEALPQLARLLEEYPTSSYAGPARQLLETAQATPSVTPATLPPAPPAGPPTPASPAP
jgi:outer membrane protein assembly factor BamD